MLHLLLSGWGVSVAIAQDTPPPPASPAAPTDAERIAALEARLAALEAQRAASDADQLLRDAEAALASAPPPPPQTAAAPSWNALNPGITAFGDLVGQVGVVDGAVTPGSTLYLRSLEVQLRADVDPFAKADAVVAWEQEAPPLEGGPGEGFGSEPEEAYIDLVALPWRLSARLGKFRQPFGLMNRMHPHDLPWTDAPELLGEEGYNDTGLVMNWILPLGAAALTVTGGALAGEPFDEDGDHASLTGLGRAELFLGHGDIDVSLGGSALRDLGGDGVVAGGDAMIRWRSSSRRSVALLGEAVDAEALSGEPGVAGYGAVQVQPARNVYVGAREDFGPDGLRTGLYVTAYTSEFLRVRAGAGYAHDSGDVTSLAQLTFVWGSHPVEPWWVNR